MCKGALTLAIVLAVHLAYAAPSARTMYADTLAREQAVRAALTEDGARATILTDVRDVVASYESLVKRYPASGYSDNALWQAGRLSLDAYARFNQQHDRDAGIRLLKRLAAGYPSSRLVKDVPAELQRAEQAVHTEQAVRAEQAPPLQVASASIATIKDIRRAVSPESVRVTIELDGEVTFHDEHITDPERVFVDLAGARAGPGLVDRTLRFEADADVIRQVRVGRHPNNVTRVVLDAAGVSSYSVYPLYSPYRIVIDCVRASKMRAAPTRAPEPLPIRSRRFTIDGLRTLPSVSPGRTAMLAAPTARVDPLAKIAGPVPTAMTTAPTAPPKNLSGSVSMARQLGLGVSRIVIDAGHGGHDPGAMGKGVTEAELVLDVALRLEALLQKVPGVDVILTRRTDEFIPLQERPAIANREGADLFLSIHANASRNRTARGIETYFLNFANNPNAAQVAARENAASALTMGALPDFVKAIALNNKLDESRDFAAQIQRSMIARLRTTNKALKNLGVKQAPFIVLIGATMPSVLAEISFITNPQEAKLLNGSAYRQRIAEALFNAIRKYQTSLKPAPTAIAHQ